MSRRATTATRSPRAQAKAVVQDVAVVEMPWLFEVAATLDPLPQTALGEVDPQLKIFPLEPIKSGSLKSENLPLEPEAERAEILHDAIARLEIEKQKVLGEGAPAPSGCWIETGKVKGKNFRQAWWRSNRPMFTAKRSRGNVEALVKTQYIGKEGGKEHQAAGKTF